MSKIILDFDDDEQVSQAFALLMDAKEDGWWCNRCKMYVDKSRVTHEEYHDLCGCRVIWMEFSAFSGKRMNPEIMDWMEKEMMCVWENFCLEMASKVYTEWVNGEKDYRCSYRLSKQLNPRNLLQYLWDTREEWAWEECPYTQPMCGCGDCSGRRCQDTGLILKPKYAKWVEFMEEVIK